MALWEQGYPLDVEYVKYVSNKLSPAFINFCLALAGYEPAALDKPFTYMELGAGFGLSVAGWAAQFTQGDFHCADYNTAQMAWVGNLADKAQLRNFSVYPRPLRQMLAEDLPQFDFVALHGFYSWVADEVRDEIKEFLRKFLKPEGCVYIGYNCKPGWSALEPLRQILVEQAKSSTAKKHRNILLDGLHLLQAAKTCGAAYFKDVPIAARKLDAWMRSDVNYLLGELQSQEHKAYFFGEICDEMAGADLVWAGPLNTEHYLEEQIFPATFTDLLNQAGRTPQLREMLKDLFLDTSFRADVFVKAARPKNAAWPGGISGSAIFSLTEKQEPFPEEITDNGRRIRFNVADYARIQNALGAGTKSFTQLLNETGLDEKRLGDALLTLVGLDWVQPALPEAGAALSARIDKFNAALDQVMHDAPLGRKLMRCGGWAGR